MKKRSMAATSESGMAMPMLYDRYLLLVAICLLAIGVLMVASTSIVISNRLYGNSFHYVARQAIYLGLSFAIVLFVLRMEVASWQKIGTALLLVTLLLLVLVLVPGIGREVNGSTRWIGFGPFGLQVSELTKFAVIVYMASYLVRHDREVRTHVKGFVKPLLLLGFVVVLLLKEPDFGASAVILATVLGMMFLAGVRLWQFALLLMAALGALAVLAISSPYRLERLTTFLNPWASQFDSGYQLTQSLIAFGRGGWFGVGLGESVQKLFYLPEAHTDFLFAVLAEELGLVGILVVMLLFAVLVWRALYIGYQSKRVGKPFAAYLAYGLGLWLCIQVMINLGVNAGVLPTKGLTLPLMSYGGTSLLISCVAVALLLRIDYESRLLAYGLKRGKLSR